MSLNELSWVAQALIGAVIGYPLAAVGCWVLEQLLSALDRWLFPPRPELDELWHLSSLGDLQFTRRALMAAHAELGGDKGGTPRED